MMETFKLIIMNTIENNKLIAEFMGNWVDKDFVAFEFGNSGSFDAINIDELKYHTSWDWLMPVVEKIGNELTSISIDFMVLKDDNYLTMVKIEKINLCITDENPIEAVYKAVVEFIKWYNSKT